MHLRACPLGQKAGSLLKGRWWQASPSTVSLGQSLGSQGTRAHPPPSTCAKSAPEVSHFQQATPQTQEKNDSSGRASISPPQVPRAGPGQPAACDHSVASSPHIPPVTQAPRHSTNWTETAGIQLWEALCYTGLSLPWQGLFFSILILLYSLFFDSIPKLG